MERAVEAGMPKSIAAPAIADFLLLLDRDEEAMRTLQEHMIDPDDPIGFEMRARYHMRRGDLPRALEEVRRGLEVDPESLYNHRTRGDIYVRMGELGKARKEYDRALNLVQDSVIDRQEIEEKARSIPG
jgi:tetratricopeptide (TPR) repeat protein